MWNVKLTLRHVKRDWKCIVQFCIPVTGSRGGVSANGVIRLFIARMASSYDRLSPCEDAKISESAIFLNSLSLSPPNHSPQLNSINHQIPPSLPPTQVSQKLYNFGGPELNPPFTRTYQWTTTDFVPTKNSNPKNTMVQAWTELHQKIKLAPRETHQISVGRLQTTKSIPY